MWIFQTYEPGQLRPLPPRAPTVVGGECIGSIIVSWTPPTIRDDSIVAYAVAVSHAGPLNEANWSQADVLTEVPARPESELFSIVIADSSSDLQPGTHAWVAVASFNSYGVMCASLSNREIDVTEPWWITGSVTDDTGLPVADVVVQDINLVPTASTGPDGRYRIGPYSNLEAVTLRTKTPDVGFPDPAQGIWYDVVAETLFFGGPVLWDFQLIGRSRLTANCSIYNDDFLTYLRSLTRTTWPTDHRPNVNLYKWDTYPVTVWIPEFTNRDGHDYGALCRQTITWWNQAMGAEYLTLVTDRNEARIVFRFGDDGPEFFGKVNLLLPSDDNYVMGEVIPELVEVYLLDKLTPPQLVQENSLHELGHALGLSGHAYCADSNYLMYVSPVGNLDNGPEQAIHFDEKRALRSVRHLPQGFDMSRVGTETLNIR